jgi:phosphoribosyl 1,2-cyclic phosphodiesterase
MAEDYFRFLGTGGARFVVSRQLRSSAGIWCSFNGSTICIDPGPGTLVRCFAGEEKVNPEDLDAVILTHRHLDHTGDANVMVEAMTGGAFKKRGVLYAPRDALQEGEPVVFSYLQQAVGRVEILKEGGSYKLDGISFVSPVQHQHGVETYGLKFNLPGGSIAFITDTMFFQTLPSHYQADILVINVVLYKHPGYEKIKHLDFQNARQIISSIRPKKAWITHFGTTMLDHDPPSLAAKLSSLTGIDVTAAEDDMVVNLRKILRA